MTDWRQKSLKRSMPNSVIGPCPDTPSCFSASVSAGRPWQSHPKRRSTRRPRIVW